MPVNYISTAWCKTVRVQSCTKPWIWYQTLSIIVSANVQAPTGATGVIPTADTAPIISMSAQFLWVSTISGYWDVIMIDEIPENLAVLRVLMHHFEATCMWLLAKIPVTSCSSVLPGKNCTRSGLYSTFVRWIILRICQCLCAYIVTSRPLRCHR